MKAYLYRVFWVRPYTALLVLLTLCILTVVVSLLYLEDAALQLPHPHSGHMRLQSASGHDVTHHDLLPDPQSIRRSRELLPLHGQSNERRGWNDDVEERDNLLFQRQAWPDRHKPWDHGVKRGHEVEVLNALEIVALNTSMQHDFGHPRKESELLGVEVKGGTVVIPQRLLNMTPAASVPRRQRYIIYLCKANITCCGWGDRQHGILSAYLISLVTNRTFGVDMSTPCSLTSLFHPRILDWKVNASSLQGLTSRHIYTVNDRLFRQIMQTIDFDAVYTEDIIYLTTNYDYFYALKANPHYTNLFRKKVRGKPRPVIFADLWQNVFKLNKRVRRRIDRTLKAARPSTQHKLVCGHVRLGKNPTIPNDSEVRNTMHTIKPLWNFLAHFKDRSKYRIFVASDSEIVRSKVLETFPGVAVDVKGDIMHIDKSHITEDACVGFEKVLADQYLLSMCDVLVLTYSVFGKSAAYMRRSNNDLYFMENGTIKPLQLFKEST